jgi:hypothetical protein
VALAAEDSTGKTVKTAAARSLIIMLTKKKKHGSHGPAMVCPVYAPKWLRELSSTTNPN